MKKNKSNNQDNNSKNNSSYNNSESKSNSSSESSQKSNESSESYTSEDQVDTDPLGSWTGVPADRNDVPTQDVDDL